MVDVRQRVPSFVFTLSVGRSFVLSGTDVKERSLPIRQRRCGIIISFLVVGPVALVCLPREVADKLGSVSLALSSLAPWEDGLLVGSPARHSTLTQSILVLDGVVSVPGVASKPVGNLSTPVRIRL